MRRSAVAAVCGLLASPIAAGQRPGAPRFEVVSVRENPAPTRGGTMSSLAGSQFTTTNIQLRMIILNDASRGPVDVLVVESVRRPEGE